MSEEEKKAIEFLKNYKDIRVIADPRILPQQMIEENKTSKEAISILLNLIEKQQKEIEELKKCYVIKPKELEKEINKEWQDKIREKIKELKTKIIGSNTGIYSAQIDILNELLEE